jgi:hypothetical protein
LAASFAEGFVFFLTVADDSDAPPEFHLTKVTDALLAPFERSRCRRHPFGARRGRRLAMRSRRRSCLQTHRPSFPLFPRHGSPGEALNIVHQNLDNRFVFRCHLLFGTGTPSLSKMLM